MFRKINSKNLTGFGNLSGFRCEIIYFAEKLYYFKLYTFFLGKYMTTHSTPKLTQMMKAWLCALLLLTWTPWSPVATAAEETTTAEKATAAEEAVAVEPTVEITTTEEVVDAAPTAEIEFTKDYQEIVTGDLVPGGKFTVKYDSKRINCSRSYRYGQPTWNIMAYVQFAEDAEPEYKVLQPSGAEGDLTQEFEIPASAKKVIMWFYNWGYFSGFNKPECYDSDYGANYHFGL